MTTKILPLKKATPEEIAEKARQMVDGANVNPAAAESADMAIFERASALIAEGKDRKEAFEIATSEAEQAFIEEVKAQARIDAQIALQKAFERAQERAIADGVTDPNMPISAYVETKHFMNLRPFPTNRKVEARITAKKNIHLKGEITADQQYKVAVVETVKEAGPLFYDADEPLMIIDGHSRIAAWNLYKQSEGKKGLQVPEKVEVTFHRLADAARIVKLYKVYTESLAQSTSKESNHIDDELSGFKPVSGLLQSSWRSAFTTIERIPYNESRNKFIETLKILDSWNLLEEKGKGYVKRHTTGIRAAILETYETADAAEKLPKWEKFWKDFLAQSVDEKGKPVVVAATLKESQALRFFVQTTEGAGSEYIGKTRTEAKQLFTAFLKKK